MCVCVCALCWGETLFSWPARRGGCSVWPASSGHGLWWFADRISSGLDPGKCRFRLWLGLSVALWHLSQNPTWAVLSKCLLSKCTEVSQPPLGTCSCQPFLLGGCTLGESGAAPPDPLTPCTVSTAAACPACGLGL